MFRSLATSTLHRAAAHAARAAGWLRAVPEQCAVCAAWPARTFCDDCVRRFAQPAARCATCALAVAPGVDHCGACQRNAPPLDRCLAAVTYAYPWAGCITDLKFHGRAGLARALALLVRSTPWVEPALDAAEVVLPLPLSRERLRERGFNQAALLARHLAGPKKVDTDVLLRIRHTPAHSGLDRAARLAGVRGAFAIDPLHTQRIAGRHVVLVDDVMTSGATLFTAAEVVRRAGAAHVTAVVVARTEFGD